MGWKSIDDMDMTGKVVLVRVDLNVPMTDGQVSDMTRIEKIVPTIRAIIAKGGKPVLLSHFGRPKGKPVHEMSLAQIIPALQAALPENHVAFAEDCIGGVPKHAVSDMRPGDVLLLENTRFHPGEEKNDPQLAAAFAALGEIYVNDAFSAAHRAHASTEAIAHLLPACAGRLMEAELKALEAALGDPEHPVVAIVGGAKVSTKLELLGNLIAKVDHLVIGGGMANTFLFAKGVAIGRSLAEKDMAETARDILDKAQAAKCTVHLPVDIAIAKEFRAGAESSVFPVDQCPEDAMILDAGPQTVERLATLFETCRTLIWNGPLGVFEMPPFDTATRAAAAKAAELTKAGTLISVAGGGDTVAALKAAGVAGDFSFISTAGGAFLEWMEGKTLPGVAALDPR